MISKFYQQWKEAMSDSDRSGLDKDIERLKHEAPAVRRTEEVLDRMIFNGINENRLKDTSSVTIRVILSELNVAQRQRVLTYFEGKLYERSDTHKQFRVYVDSKATPSFLVLKEMPKENHFCIIGLR
jgi:hypothetical protein